ncbi:hypothetical protein QCA50_007998 [Cerrena zonata]|uniref:Uncharacterized protein n=1 Tax=Cerrena zonata TaxID=2478898 RepID=A0AAW0GBE7_9APHY
MDKGVNGYWAELPTDDPNAPKGIYTHATNPFKPERVKAILKVVTVGDNLTDNKKWQVHDLIVEYADCFALLVSEVSTVQDAVHRLNVPDNAVFAK